MKRQTGRGIIIHENKILLIERWRDGLHYFSIPGGGLERQETSAEATAREINEETSLHVRVGRLLYDVTIEGSHHQIFWCDYLDGEPVLRPNAPEASIQSDSNRHQPCWIPTAAVKELPFIYWQPLKSHLVHDLEHGFANHAIRISA